MSNKKAPANKLTIKINKPVKKVFEFVTNPVNTPKWIDFINKEETNEWPVKLGTIYKNQDMSGEWQELEITEFEKDKMFLMTNHKTGYCVRYTLTNVDDNSTELEYCEWLVGGELKELFTM